MKDLIQDTHWDDPSHPQTQWDDLWEKWDTANDDFISTVERGRQGLNVGLDDGCGRINNYLYGTHIGRYYLIGADSGVGKSTRLDYKLWNLWYNSKKANFPIHIHYYSLEMSKLAKVANWVAFVVHNLYNIEMPAEYILGRMPDKRVNDPDMKRIKIAYSIVQEFLKSVYFYEGSIHPTGFLNRLVDNYYDNPLIGTVHRAKPTEPTKKGYIIGYTPKNPRLMTVVAMDHIALMHEEKGLTSTKLVMDRTSMYLVQLRNIFNTTSIILQQFNTELNSTFRLNRKNESSLYPQRLDFGDSKYTFRDADVVEGLIKPFNFDIATFKGYDVVEMGNNLLFDFLMKNRYGKSDRAFPLFFNGAAGTFTDLPLDPRNLILMEPWYKEAKRLKNSQ